MHTGGNTAHTHIHNRCVAGRRMIQLVVGEDVLSLLYPVSAGIHCVDLNSPVASTDQHLEGGHSSMLGRCLWVVSRLIVVARLSHV